MELTMSDPRFYLLGAGLVSALAGAVALALALDADVSGARQVAAGGFSLAMTLLGALGLLHWMDRLDRR